MEPGTKQMSVIRAKQILHQRNFAGFTTSVGQLQFPGSGEYLFPSESADRYRHKRSVKFDLTTKSNHIQHVVRENQQSPSPPTGLHSRVQCLKQTEVSWFLGSNSERMEALWAPAGPASPSEEPSAPPAWL